MSKHTPGLLRVIETKERMYSDDIRLVDADDKTIAFIPCDDTVEIDDGAIAETHSPEAKANAVLLAAAPELLAALEGIMAAPMSVKAMMAAHSAIRKAKVEI